MIQIPENMSIHTTKIRGIEYVTLSFLDGDEEIEEYFGNLIKNTFETVNSDDFLPK